MFTKTINSGEEITSRIFFNHPIAFVGGFGSGGQKRQRMGLRRYL